MRVLTWILLFAAASAFAAPAPPVAPRPPVAAPPVAQPPVAQPPVAQPPPPAQPAFTAVDPDDVPARCHDLAVRAGSPDRGLAQSARVSLAMCTAQESTRALAVCDCEQSVHELDDAVAPALAMLDEIAAIGDPAWQILALHAEGDVLAQNAQRIVSAVPPASTPDQQQLHDIRVQLAQQLVQPWLERARQRFADVVHEARAHRELAGNAMVASAVADSERRIGPAVVTR